jgi:hypothetical protein
LPPGADLAAAFSHVGSAAEFNSSSDMRCLVH